jgi:hypothetical protein
MPAVGLQGGHLNGLHGTPQDARHDSVRGFVEEDCASVDGYGHGWLPSRLEGIQGRPNLTAIVFGELREEVQNLLLRNFVTL